MQSVAYNRIFACQSEFRFSLSRRYLEQMAASCQLPLREFLEFLPSIRSALLTTKIQVLAFSLALAPELLLVPARHAMEL